MFIINIIVIIIISVCQAILSS